MYVNSITNSFSSNIRDLTFIHVINYTLNKSVCHQNQHSVVAYTSAIFPLSLEKRLDYKIALINFRLLVK